MGSLPDNRIMGFDDPALEGYVEPKEEYATIRAVEYMSSRAQPDQTIAEQVRQCYLQLALQLLTQAMTATILATSSIHIRLKAEGDVMMVSFEPRLAAQARFSNGYEQMNLEVTRSTFKTHSMYANSSLAEDFIP